MTALLKIQRALISVSDKTDLIPFCQTLRTHGVEILSTGGTAQYLRDADIPVTLVEEYTGFPEMMDGRVKTLHPKIHAGLLARRGVDDQIMQAHDILPIDLIVINLYPFAKTIAKPDCTFDAAIAQIDIGGPAMIRSAAKNHAFVTVLVDPRDYATVQTELQQHEGMMSAASRLHYATKAFASTAQYDSMIAHYLQPHDQQAVLFPEQLTLGFQKIADLSYGENPHQQAALYQEYPSHTGVAQVKQQQGKPLSFNNLLDADMGWQCVQSFQTPACVIVKHSNPCGVAIGVDAIEAYQRAFNADPMSAFGGIIACNQPLTGALAQTILATQFVEVIIAPAMDDDARTFMTSKPNVRVLLCPAQDSQATRPVFDYKRIDGGLLVQTMDNYPVSPAHWRCVTDREPTTDEWIDLQFAWQVVKYVKSNAIVYAKSGQTIGIGMGQTSRVASSDFGWQKAQQAGLAQPCAMASDAFFPFRDGIDVAARAGVTSIVQPGGSMRDEEVIRAANEHGIAMVFTEIRHFRH